MNVLLINILWIIINNFWIIFILYTKSHLLLYNSIQYIYIYPELFCNALLISMNNYFFILFSRYLLHPQRIKWRSITFIFLISICLHCTRTMNSGLNPPYSYLRANESFERESSQSKDMRRARFGIFHFRWAEVQPNWFCRVIPIERRIGAALHAKIPTESPTSFTIASVGARERPESLDGYSIIRENKRPSMRPYIARSACQPSCICSVRIVSQIARLHNNFVFADNGIRNNLLTYNQYRISNGIVF